MIWKFWKLISALVLELSSFYLDKPSLPRLSTDAKKGIPTKGSFYEMKCIADFLGYPRGKYKWLKDGSDVSNSASVVVKYSSRFVILQFPDLKKNENGNYTCNIANSAGAQSKSFELLVFGKCIIL